MAHYKKETIKTFVHWDAPQLFKLINMNHNKYMSSCKSLDQKWWWTKLGTKVLFKQWGGAKCAFKMFLGIAPP